MCGAGDQLSIGERGIRRLDVLADVARALRVTLGDLLGEPVLWESEQEHNDIPAILAGS
jgi:hypothetical protein